MTSGAEKPLVHVLPVSAFTDFRAFASTSCCRIGPAVWMNFPVDTPIVLARGRVHIAAGSTKLFHADHVMEAPVTTARMCPVRPSCPSNAMLTSAWITSSGALFRYATPSARPPPMKPLGVPAASGGLSAAWVHVAV